MVVEQMFTILARDQLTEVRHFLASMSLQSVGFWAWMPAYWVCFCVVAGSLWRGNIDK